MRTSPASLPSPAHAVPDALRWETGILLLVLIVLNFPLVQGDVPQRWIFFPEAVRGGEWWRVIFHPLAHVSLYHLVLDAGAFFLIYRELGGLRVSRRLLLLAGTAASSLLAVVLFWPPVATFGFCGLSGIVHGLVAFWATQLRSSGRCSALGAGVLIALVAKCAVEMVWGTGWTAAFHPGQVGIPVAVSHAGGAAGGLLLAWLFKCRFRR
jgi:rhomboid family GlyGly-CTERM serine protease